ncbi:hypothetical protein V6Z12_D02G222500 [Gossypium hirsutum]
MPHFSTAKIEFRSSASKETSSPPNPSLPPLSIIPSHSSHCFY